MRSSKPILLVEDDKIDAMTVKRALQELNVANQLIHTLNGEEAVEYLRNNGNQKPCVILLDLNMPRMNGIEFLKVTKADDALKRIPVVVLTTSKDEQNIVDSFRLNVAGYILKSADHEKFVDAMRTVNIYWTLSELPNGE
jgi:DNA-binding NarL/FixJ family response regulator